MQLGRILQRIMFILSVYLAKVDIADGFYQVWLQASDVAKLGVVLPTAPGTPLLLVAFLLELPLGWVSSPAPWYFVAETACGLTNVALRRRAKLP
jgi:hypothetical protein